jgi:hypothetical protein
MELRRVCRPIVADLRRFDEEQDPDPDPHQSKKSDPGLHQSENRDPDLDPYPHLGVSISATLALPMIRFKMDIWLYWETLFRIVEA